jgi:hypothetical protein
MAFNGSPILESAAAARWAGDAVRALGTDDEIVTLSPHQIIDSGLELDPRFAAGPFVYRTGWTMTQAQARKVNAMIPATLTDLDSDPPDAILVGYEEGTRKLPLRPDEGLAAYAKQRAYRMIAMPDGIGQLYIRGTHVLKAVSASLHLSTPRHRSRAPATRGAKPVVQLPSPRTGN